MPFSLHLQSRAGQVAAALEGALTSPGEDLAPAALAIARIEYPSLDPSRYVAILDRMGADVRTRLAARGRLSAEDALQAFHEYLYDEQGFTGNRDRYDDPRNSFLNEVLDRRMGIPISLAIVYLEVARRAHLDVAGVNFPGHFLLRVALAGGRRSLAPDVLIVDPFHSGARLSESDCRELLRQHVGDAAAFDRSLLDPATRHDIVVRVLVNLKRLYVRMRSFPQARLVSDLLLAVDPSAITELRDRGLLAYHLQDFAAALRDLEAYLRLLPRRPADEVSVEALLESTDDSEGIGEEAQIWEHVKTLRKRVAGFN
ncbi:MAG TPA: tetratricopeptide repeat protein [Vicinamibacterales bacterium]|nr:tetratricopeptide repeat protein [Vicinamibacterales bacterium]